MAQDHGLFDDEGADFPFDPVVYVGTADACVVYCNQYIVGILDCGLGTLGKGDVEGFVEDEGEVLFLYYNG